MYHLRSKKSENETNLQRSLTRSLKQKRLKVNHLSQPKNCKSGFKKSQKITFWKQASALTANLSDEENILKQNPDTKSGSFDESEAVAGLKSWLNASNTQHSNFFSKLDNIHSDTSTTKQKCTKTKKIVQDPSICSSFANSEGMLSDAEFNLSVRASAKNIVASNQASEDSDCMTLEHQKSSVKQSKNVIKALHINSNQYSPVILLNDVTSSGSDTSTPVLQKNLNFTSKKSLFGFEKLLQPSALPNLNHCKLSPIVDAPLVSFKANKQNRTRSKHVKAKSVQKQCDLSKKGSQTANSIEIVDAPLLSFKTNKQNRTRSKHVEAKSVEKQCDLSKKDSQTANSIEIVSPSENVDEKSEFELFNCSYKAEQIEEEQSDCDDYFFKATTTVKSKSKRKKPKVAPLKPFQEPEIMWDDIMNHELVIE